jgi:hypothetical protein
LLAVADLAERVGLLGCLDVAVRGFTVRERGCSGGEFLVSMACARLAGADHLSVSIIGGLTRSAMGSAVTAATAQSRGAL